MVSPREVPLLKGPIGFFSLYFRFFLFLFWSDSLSVLASFLAHISRSRTPFAYPFAPMRYISKCLSIPTTFFFFFFFFPVLNGWNVLHQLLSFLSFCSLFVLLFSLISHAIVHFGMILAHTNALLYKNTYTHKWILVGTYKYTYMLGKIWGIKNKNFGHNVMRCFYCLLFFEARCHARAFSEGQKFWKV